MVADQMSHQRHDAAAADARSSSRSKWPALTARRRRRLRTCRPLGGPPHETLGRQRLSRVCTVVYPISRPIARCAAESVSGPSRDSSICRISISAAESRGARASSPSPAPGVMRFVMTCVVGALYDVCRKLQGESVGIDFAGMNRGKDEPREARAREAGEGGQAVIASATEDRLAWA